MWTIEKSKINPAMHLESALDSPKLMNQGVKNASNFTEGQNPLVRRSIWSRTVTQEVRKLK
jgi:hypothetical protein